MRTPQLTTAAAVMAAERVCWRVSAARPASGSPVPRKACPVVETRSDGQPYRIAADDGRRGRWHKGPRRIPVSPRQFSIIAQRLAALEFQPPALTEAEQAKFAGSVQALLVRLFVVSGDKEQTSPRRLPITAAQYAALRRSWQPNRWLASDATSAERKLAGERVRDWLNRTFVVIDSPTL